MYIANLFFKRGNGKYYWYQCKPKTLNLERNLKAQEIWSYPILPKKPLEYYQDWNFVILILPLKQKNPNPACSSLALKYYVFQSQG